MRIQNYFVNSFLFFALLLSFQNALSCSTYKVTYGGKTMVGSNYDNWLLTPRIWFETNGYKTAFSGARPNGVNGFAPQTGLNEFGLAFITLATATPENGIAPANKKQIGNRTLYLKDIMHHCKTVDEAKVYIDEFNHSSLSQDVFLYVDKTGRYLVVEPYSTTLGDNSKYVLANFCPSTISDLSTIKQARYVNGSAFLKNKIDSTLSFCTALSDTMHVCRRKLGDGTLLTSILNLNEGIIYLYFYHDYKHVIKLNLKEEFAMGNHFFEIPPLFPPNSEFKKLAAFMTPSNSKTIDFFLRICALLYFISAFFYLVSYFIKRQTTKYAYIKLLLALLSLIAVFYVFLLVRIENIYYFPAPYTDGSFSVVSLSSYIPFLILALIFPLLAFNKKILKESTWNLLSKLMLTLNNVTYMILIALFCNWGLYNVFA